MAYSVQNFPLDLFNSINTRDKSQIQLRASDTSAVGQEYCTLCHCRRTSQLATLEQHDMSKIHNNKPMRVLSKIYQLTVLAVCKHEFRFICIDALCIV